MNCTDIEERLSAWLDAEDAPDERPAVEAHLAGCDDCRRSLDALRAQDREIDVAFEPLRRQSDALASRVIARLNARRPWIVGALSAAAGFLIAFILFREPVSVISTDKGASLMIADGPRIALATGAVEAGNGPIPADGTIADGTSLRTAKGVTCEIMLSDGSELRMNEMTEVLIETDRCVELRQGEVFAKIVSGPFEIRAGRARVATSSGTFDLTHLEGVATVMVLDGKAVVGNHSISAGDAHRFTDGALSACMSARDPSMATRWVHDLLVLKGSKDPELRRRVADLVGRHDAEIRRLGCVAAPALVDVLRAPGARRHEAARLLADLADAPDLPALVDLLKDEDPEVRAAILRGIQRLTGKP